MSKSRKNTGTTRRCNALQGLGRAERRVRLGRRDRLSTCGRGTPVSFAFRCALLVFLTAGSAVTAGGTEAAPDFSKLAPVGPCPALVAAARARQIPLMGIEPPGEPGRLNPGDACTGLVTLCEKNGRRTQWLFHLTVLSDNAAEAPRHPPGPLILYSGRSNKLEYASAPASVRLRTLGPYAEAGAARGRAKPKDESVTFSLNKGFLGIGLDLAAETICRAEQTDPDNNLDGAF